MTRLVAFKPIFPSPFGYCNFGEENRELNKQLIALEKSFISDKGMYFGAWYKSIYASSDPFSGYGAWILPGLEYELSLIHI